MYHFQIREVMTDESDDSDEIVSHNSNVLVRSIMLVCELFQVNSECTTLSVLACKSAEDEENRC